MRILVLTQIIPYPPDAGPKVKTWHTLRYLVEQGHDVSLASFVRPDELVFLPVLQNMGLQVFTVPIHRSRPADVGYWLKSQWKRRPFLVERDRLAGMLRLVDDLTRTCSFQILHADQLTMAQFALGKRVPGHTVTVFDDHNAVWTIVRRMQETVPWFLKPVLALEAQRVKAYEGCLVRSFDHTLAVTEIDRRYLLQAAGLAEDRNAERIHVIPITVDTHTLTPVRRLPGSTNLLTLGTLHYPPNADGIRWFVNQVFPQIVAALPEVSLTIVGKNPPADFADFAARYAGRVTVTGYVPELQPYLEQAAAVVVPVRVGSGMRVRIQEAFARAMPVVTTTIGLEGIEARPGEDVLVADRPEDFAAATLRLLRDPDLQERLAVNGRALAEARYDWRVVMRNLEAIYLASSNPPGAPAQ